MRAQNFLRLCFSKSFLVVTRMFADGYRRRNSEAHCSVRWLGTTKRDFWHRPSRLASIAAPTISNVLPAPTSWANSVLPPYSTWAMAFFWCSRRVMAGFMPPKTMWLPSYSRGRVAFISSLYWRTSACRRSGSRQIQSRKASRMACCFWAARVVSLAFSTRRSLPSASSTVS